MKTYKIGSILHPYYNYKYAFYLFNKYNPDISLEYIDDPYNNYCDLIIYSCYIDNIEYYNWDVAYYFHNIELEKFNYDISNVKFCLIHPEPHAFPHKDYYNTSQISNFYELKGNNYAISHFIDSPTNCFYPYLCYEHEYLLSHNFTIKDFCKNVKTQFCSIISSTESIHRRKYIELIFNYKNIDVYGKISQNSLRLSDEELDNIMNNSKFNLAIENSVSIGGEAYITEKIGKSYIHGCIPIYFGSNYVTELFNKKTFINANKLSEDNLIECIKEIDNNETLYNEIISTPILKNPNFNYAEYFAIKRYTFIRNILEDKI